MRNELVELLHEGHYSCVVGKDGEIRTYTRRGVIDLFELYQSDSEFMEGAEVADKVIGKGAAAVLALGKVSEMWADVLSESARRLLDGAGVKVECGKVVPFIINRTGTGRCPLETACDVSEEPEELYPVICDFVAQMK